MQPVRSQRILLSTPDNNLDGRIRLPKAGAEARHDPNVRRHWDYIYKRGQQLRDTLASMTPSVREVDKTRAARLDAIGSMFKRN